MSVTACPECGGRVSYRADHCPHCGLPGQHLRASHASDLQPADDRPTRTRPDEAFASDLARDRQKVVTVSTQAARSGLLAAFLWMFLLSVLLFWLPFLGSLIAGFVGGRKAGNALLGLLAASMPALGLALLVFAGTSYLAEVPVIGAIAGGGTFILLFILLTPLALGAVVGGATAAPRVSVTVHTSLRDSQTFNPRRG